MSEPIATETIPQQGLRFMPKSAWAGLVIGLIGFTVSFTLSSTEKVNGQITQCSSINIGGFVVAFLVLLCLAMAWQRRAGMHLTYRPTTTLMGVVSAVLGVLAILHVLRGLGVIMGGC